jgi:ABC-2 type transport system permease protein
MDKLLLVAKRDYLTNLRKKSFLLMMFGFPLLMLLIFGIQFFFAGQLASGSIQGTVGFVDQSGLNVTSNSTTLVQFQDERGMKDALLNGTIDSGFLVPSDYLANGTVILFVQKGEVWKSTTNTRPFEALLSDVLFRGVDKEVAARIRDPANVQTVELDQNGAPVQRSVLESMAGMALGVVLIFSVFMTSSFLLQSVTEEKENRMIEVILSSVSSRQLLAGKIIGLAALSLTQMFVWFASSAVLLQFAAPSLLPLGAINVAALFDPGTLFIYFLYFIGGFLLYSSLLAGIGAISPSARESQQLVSVVILPAVVPLWFINAILANPNGPVAQALSIFPLSAPLGMILRMGLTEVPAQEIAASLLVMALSIVLAVWASAKVFRAAMLMYGKRPSLGEIVRFIKEA